MMKESLKISNATIKRLPRYRRNLLELKKMNTDKVSSDELGRRVGFAPSLVRQDLCQFGGFGLHGYGYNIRNLLQNVNLILGLHREYRIIIIGAGHLGMAIARSIGFNNSTFKIAAVFDNNPKLIGREIEKLRIYDYDNLGAYLKSNNIDIGVICITNQGQELVDTLYQGGVKGIWNLTSKDLEVVEGIVIENVHLSDSLYSLTYRIDKLL